MNGQHHPGGQQAGGGEEGDRAHADHLERVDLLVDPHRAELGDDAGADLGGHDVAEHVGDHLAQVAPGREDAGVGGGADGAVEVGALDPALEAQDEDHPPDHQRRAQDQDPGLAQGLAEEAEHAPVEDVAEGLAAELDDVAERGDPVPRDREPAAHHRITRISGWVASRVWVKT